MVWFLVATLAGFFAIVLAGAPRVWRVFSGGPLVHVGGVTVFTASVFVALTAMGGGITVAAGVDKFPTAWLAASIFTSYLIPGLILSVIVGGSSVAAAVNTLRTAKLGAHGSILAGVILLGWLVGERVILPREAFNPQFGWLESIYVLAGLLMVVPALAICWAAQRSRFRANTPLRHEGSQ